MYWENSRTWSNKTELALIQSYTGVELLKNSDIKYLKRFEKFSDDNIKEKLFNICIQKESADNRTLQDFEKLSKTKTYVSRILIAIVVLCIITAVICIILFGINIDSSSISDYIGIILVCIFGAAISSVLYGYFKRNIKKRSEIKKPSSWSWSIVWE